MTQVLNTEIDYFISSGTDIVTFLFLKKLDEYFQVLTQLIRFIQANGYIEVI